MLTVLLEIIINGILTSIGSLIRFDVKKLRHLKNLKKLLYKIKNLKMILFINVQLLLHL